MEIYIIIDGGNPQKVKFEYEINDLITVNNVILSKCIKKEIIDNRLY